jgi:hypothetical protein
MAIDKFKVRWTEDLSDDDFARLVQETKAVSEAKRTAVIAQRAYHVLLRQISDAAVARQLDALGIPREERYKCEVEMVNQFVANPLRSGETGRAQFETGSRHTTP